MVKEQLSIADHFKIIHEQLRRMEASLLSQKTVLTFDETAVYTGMSKSHLYKLTMNRAIPHYKPGGKLINTYRPEIDQWMLQNRVKPIQEIEANSSLTSH